MCELALYANVTGASPMSLTAGSRDARGVLRRLNCQASVSLARRSIRSQDRLGQVPCCARICARRNGCALRWQILRLGSSITLRSRTSQSLEQPLCWMSPSPEPARAGIQARVHSSMKTSSPRSVEFATGRLRTLLPGGVFLGGRRNIGGTQARHDNTIQSTAYSIDDKLLALV